MPKLLLVARNVLIIGVMLWLALSYQNNHRFAAPPHLSSTPMTATSAAGFFIR
jgi:Co/Zn/Cd efflux system component